MEEKIHWQRLKEVCNQFKNGEVIIKIQDGLPVVIMGIRGERNNIKLTEPD